MAAEPPTTQHMRRFVETEDWALLEKPIVFDRTPNFSSYLCCQAVLADISSVGCVALVVPIQSCCPGVMTKRFSLRLDQHSVQLDAAYNDCCCHVATVRKTVPLEKIQDVQLEQTCLHSCCGVKQVNVETAGQGGAGGPEIMAAFLAEPDLARQAIQAAVKLQKLGHAAAPLQQGGMERAGGAAGGGPGVAMGGRTLSGRLRSLDALVKGGALTAEEAAHARVAVLSAEHDLMPRLQEAAGLLHRGLISADDYQRVKGAILAQLARG